MEQSQLLVQILKKSDPIRKAVERVALLGLEEYYIGGGCIAQTVWNYLSHQPLEYGISDIDVAYYDQEHLDYESEDQVLQRVREQCGDIEFELDVKNEARVHIWYESHFGYPIQPYTCVEEAIDTWPSTATAVGVRMKKDGTWKVYAPFGLDDLFQQIVRANKVQVTRQVYEQKAEKWKKKWPNLRIIPWET